MIHLIKHSLKNYLSVKRHHHDWHHDDVYKSFELVKKYKYPTRKSYIKIIREVNYLCKYWNCFPDMYFRFGHFLTDAPNMEIIKTFIPQKAYGKFTYQGLDCSPYSVLVNDKVVFHDLMNYYGLPVPSMHFTISNGIFMINNEEVSDSEIDNLLTNLPDKRIFVKIPNAGAASGVFLFEKKGGIYFEGNNKVDSRYIRTKFGLKKAFFEKALIQEPILKSFNPDTVNTLRVMTLNMEGKSEIVSAAVRFGRVGGFVDNAAKGGIAVSLDIETGKLGEWGVREYDLEKFYEHPDTHIKFKDVEVTQWPAVKDIVLKTLKYFPPYRSLGFDVATTEDGPIIIEINTGSGIYLSQMGKVIGLSEKFKNYIPHYCK